MDGTTVSEHLLNEDVQITDVLNPEDNSESNTCFSLNSDQVIPITDANNTTEPNDVIELNNSSITAPIITVTELTEEIKKVII